jgi:hypothetical protein
MRDSIAMMPTPATAPPGRAGARHGAWPLTMPVDEFVRFVAAGDWQDESDPASYPLVPGVFADCSEVVDGQQPGQVSTFFRLNNVRTMFHHVKVTSRLGAG